MPESFDLLIICNKANPLGTKAFWSYCEPIVTGWFE